jgi:DNA polymerase-3 subunit beta
MKAIVDNKKFAHALSVLSRGISKQGSHHPLQIEANGTLRLSVSHERDLEMVLPLVESEGLPWTAALNGPKLAELVGRLPQGELTLALEGSALQVQAGSFSARLTLVQADGLTRPSFTPGTVTVPAERLCTALKAVRYAVSRQVYRGIFEGIQLEVGPDLKAVASDGYRLATYTASLETGGQAFKVVLPLAAVADILSLFEETGADLQLAYEQGRVALLSPEACLAFAPMAGEFPDYWKVIPQNFLCETTLNSAQLEAALRRLQLVAEQHNRRVDLLFEKDQLHLRTEGDYGAAKETIPARMEVKDDFIPEVVFNARYLLEALPPKAEEVRLRLSGTTTPAMVVPTDGSGYLAVVVPLRI